MPREPGSVRKRRTSYEIDAADLVRSIAQHGEPAWILAWDLGTVGAVSVWSVREGIPVDVQTWDVARKGSEHRGVPFLRWTAIVDGVLRDAPRALVAYEDVKRHAGISDAHAWGGWRAVLFARAAERGFPTLGVSVQSVKAYLTGNGAAEKDAITRAASARYPGLAARLVTPDSADSLGVGGAALGALRSARIASRVESIR